MLNRIWQPHEPAMLVRASQMRKGKVIHWKSTGEDVEPAIDRIALAGAYLASSDFAEFLKVGR